jgi:hypothetical protein
MGVKPWDSFKSGANSWAISGTLCDWEACPAEVFGYAYEVLWLPAHLPQNTFLIAAIGYARLPTDK